MHRRVRRTCGARIGDSLTGLALTRIRTLTRNKASWYKTRLGGEAAERLRGKGRNGGTASVEYQATANEQITDSYK